MYTSLRRSVSHTVIAARSIGSVPFLKWFNAVWSWLQKAAAWFKATAVEALRWIAAAAATVFKILKITILAIILLCAVALAWRISRFVWGRFKRLSRRSHQDSIPYFAYIHRDSNPATESYHTPNAQDSESLSQEQFRAQLRSEQVQRESVNREQVQRKQAQEAADQHAKRQRAARIQQQRLEDDRIYQTWHQKSNEAFHNTALELPLPPSMCKLSECNTPQRSPYDCTHSVSRLLSSNGDFSRRQKLEWRRWHPDQGYFIKRGDEAKRIATKIFQQIGGTLPYEEYTKHGV